MDKETRISLVFSEFVEISEHEKGPDAIGVTASDGLASQASSVSLPEAPGIPDRPDGSPAHTVPEGGLDAWLQVLGSWVILLGELNLSQVRPTPIQDAPN